MFYLLCSKLLLMLEVGPMYISFDSLVLTTFGVWFIFRVSPPFSVQYKFCLSLFLFLSDWRVTFINFTRLTSYNPNYDFFTWFVRYKLFWNEVFISTLFLLNSIFNLNSVFLEVISRINREPFLGVTVELHLFSRFSLPFNLIDLFEIIYKCRIYYDYWKPHIASIV